MAKLYQLEKYDKPRILMVDFSPQDVEKIRQQGYHALRGATGLLDRGEFNIPGAVQDFEIVAFNCAKDAFTDMHSRKPAATSVEKTPAFVELMKEVWAKYGWVVLFIQDMAPRELEYLGLSDIGVIEQGREYSSPDAGRPTIRTGYQPKVATFPEFRSKTILFEGFESDVLERYVQSAAYRVLGVDRHSLKFEPSNHAQHMAFLCVDQSAQPNILAMRFYHQKQRADNESTVGGFLILPNYGTKNVNVFEAILKEKLPERNPDLFTVAPFMWLDEYCPVPARQVLLAHEEFMKKATAELERLDAQYRCEMETYAWLNTLLTGMGDELQEAVVKALELLGFEVDTVDDKLASGAAKREDLRVRLASADYFAVGEVKSTRRGAEEGFITQVQNHQGRYSREQRCPIPEALLIVNHSIELSPNKRSDRFYKDPSLADRLLDQGIVAIDTVALHELCQRVLLATGNRTFAQDLLMSGPIVRLPLTTP